MNERVLVTGGGGFIGSHLVKSQLELGNQVRAVDLHPGHLAQLVGHPNLEAVTGDLTDSALLAPLARGIDVIYHLASAHLNVGLAKGYYWEVNVTATLNLVQQAVVEGVKRFIHCSSNGVYGKLHHLPADENTPCNPGNIYEKTKLAGEKAVLRTAQETGLPLVVIRPSWVYGPGCPRTEKLFRMIQKGRFVFFGDGRTLRHPVYIADAIRGIELSAAAPHASGEIYLIAGEETVTLNELVQRIANVLQVKVRSYHIPAAFGLLSGYLLQQVYKPLGKQPPFSVRSLDFFLKDNAYDIQKAQQQLGYQPQVSLQAGLELTARWLDQPIFPGGPDNGKQ